MVVDLSALFVSPHLDDVAFSCSGTLASLRRRGWQVAVATVFTRSVAGPTGFALACQLDKGLAPDVDYMALRRAEDADFGRELGVDALEWLDLAEAPHRGYESAPALFDGILPGDQVADEVAERLDRLVNRLRPAWIFAPQGVGNHVDHRQVIRAILGRSAWCSRVAWYRDLPYAARFPEAKPSADLPGDLVEVASLLDPPDLLFKGSAAACYRSQVPFQFGGEALIPQVLGDFARVEAARLGEPGPIEAFRVDPGAVLAWNREIRTST